MRIDKKKEILSDKIHDFQYLINRIKKTEEIQESLEGKITLLNEKFNKLCPDVCPFCDQPIE